MPRASALLAVFLPLLAASSAFAENCTDSSVYLRGDWGSARFSVEIADEPAEHSRGLMYRESMPSSSGMLFIYDSPRRLSFWMRNTLIELDMLFIDQHGIVQKIHHRAQPLDETPIPGGDDLLAVLEINGGMAQRLGIAKGSQLRHPAFSNRNPAWPCADN